ncbi:MAG: glycosyltransferase family 4 protein [Rhodospirillaceae bacterium]
MKIGIGWQVGLPSGWGTYGMNLTLRLVTQGHQPVPLSLAQQVSVTPLELRLLERPIQAFRMTQKLMELHGRLDLPHCVLHGLGDQLLFAGLSDRMQGIPDIGVLFMESATVPEENLERAKALPLIITGSSWNQRVLEGLGLTNARFCPQGIEPSLFHPAPRAGMLPKDRFVIFSGGKLEFRKGQDILIAAFREFQRAHPDALLVTAWTNLWQSSLETLKSSRHVSGLPTLDERGKLGVHEWLVANGLPADSIVDLGPVANSAMPRLLGEADLAVFPNRCEGGTNLVAMEAMACGVPCILSANTGHFDLIDKHNDVPTAYAIDRQIDIGEVTGTPRLKGWGETTVEDLVATMERAYANQAERQAIGNAGAQFMGQWSWDSQVRKLVELIGSVS